MIDRTEIFETFSQSEIESREKAAHDWGRKDYQAELLNKLEKWMDELYYKDATGHGYALLFQELIESVKP